MKYAVIILSGAADRPLDELGGRTPLAAARMPHLQDLAHIGRVGSVATIPHGWPPTLDIALLSIFGHDPTRVGGGRAAFEAAGLGIDADDATVFRLDLVTIGVEGDDDAGVVLDHTAGGLPDAEADALVTDLLEHWRRTAGDLVRDLELTPARGHRVLAFDRSPRDFSDVVTAPPRMMLGKSAERRLPGGGEPGAAECLRQLIESSYTFLASHEVNLARVEQGLPAANLAWFWGQGRTPMLPTLQQQFGLSGLVFGASKVLRGVARLSGWDVVRDAAMHDLARLGEQAAAAVDAADCVLVHLQQPDQASHLGDWQRKTDALEKIDRCVIGPIRTRLASFGDAEADPHAEGWRMMVLADHATPCATREHDGMPVPVTLAGAWIRSAVVRSMHEADAEQSDMCIDPGHELLEYCVRSGLAGKRRRSAGRGR